MFYCLTVNTSHLHRLFETLLSQTTDIEGIFQTSKRITVKLLKLSIKSWLLKQQPTRFVSS